MKIDNIKNVVKRLFFKELAQGKKELKTEEYKPWVSLKFLHNISVWNRENVVQWCKERNIEYPKLEQIIDDHGKKTGVFICSCENLKAKQQDGNPYIRLSEEKDTVLVARVYRHLERHHMKAVDRAKKRPNDGKQDKFMFWSSLTIKESFFLPVGYWKFIEKWFRLFYFQKITYSVSLVCLLMSYAVVSRYPLSRHKIDLETDLNFVYYRIKIFPN